MQESWCYFQYSNCLIIKNGIRRWYFRWRKHWKLFIKKTHKSRNKSNSKCEFELSKFKANAFIVRLHAIFNADNIITKLVNYQWASNYQMQHIYNSWPRAAMGRHNLCSWVQPPRCGRYHKTEIKMKTHRITYKDSVQWRFVWIGKFGK